MAKISPTAVVDKTAQLGEGVYIGPGCVIGPGVIIGDGCELRANVMVIQGTKLGKNNRLYAGCVMGEDPQSIGVDAVGTELLIGDNNIFREYVTIHRGTPEGGGKTVIGNNNFMMVNSHLGHDCQVEDNIVMVNNCHIAGHNKIERNVWLSGYTGSHQFVTFGRFAYLGGSSGPTHDVPPFVRAAGAYPCEVRGLNIIGLQRGGVSQESIMALERAYRRLYRNREGRSLASLVAEMLNENNPDENVKYLLDSLQKSNQHRMGRYRELFRHGASAVPEI